MKSKRKRTRLGRMLAAGLTAAVLGLAPATAAAQNAMNQPYSQFGVGVGEQPFNLPMATRMGGAVYSMAGSNYVNPFNPASYGAVEPESFVFDMSANVQLSTLRDRQQSLFDADGNLGYLLVAMPLTRWWKLAGGLMPYSTVDYESVALQSHPTYPGTVKTVYGGTGGVNHVFLGSAFNVLRAKGYRPDIQLGFNVNYLTGTIHRYISTTFPGNDSTYFLNSRRYKLTTVRNVTFDLGLQARQSVGHGVELQLGLVYKPYLDMKVRDMAMIYTYHTADESLVDTIFPSAGSEPEFDSRLERPQTLGIGLGVVVDKRWHAALDATLSSWQGLRYTEGQQPSVLGDNSVRYGRFSRYALALERIGSMDASSYWGRISWSLGGHLTQGQLRLQLDGAEQRLDAWGLGAGATLPMRKGRSLLTLSIGYASMGSADVLQRDTFTFGIAISSCEHWFFKRKYN